MIFSKVFLIALSSSFISNGTTSINYQKLNETWEKPVVDFEDAITKAYEFKESLKQYYGWKIDRFEDIKINDLKIINAKASAVGNPITILEDKKFNFIGEDVLKNHGDEEQIIKTVAFTKEMKDEYGTSVTAGISVEAKADFLFGSVKVKTNLSGTIDEIKTKSQKFTVPSQEVKVLPHSQKIITSYWSEVQTTQKVSISADILGTVSGDCYTHITVDGKEKYEIWKETYSLGQVLYSYFGGYKTYWPDCPKSISVNTDDSIHFEGALDIWKSEVGSHYEVNFGESTPIEE